MKCEMEVSKRKNSEWKLNNAFLAFLGYHCQGQEVDEQKIKPKVKLQKIKNYKLQLQKKTFEMRLQWNFYRPRNEIQLIPRVHLF